MIVVRNTVPTTSTSLTTSSLVKNIIVPNDTFTRKQWCSLCHKTATARHLRSKLHDGRMREYENVFSKLPNVIKYNIISYLFPTVVDDESMCRLVHEHFNYHCGIEIVWKKKRAVECVICRHFNTYDSFAQFHAQLSKQGMCLNCAYQWFRSSSYLNGLDLFVYNGFVYTFETSIDNNDDNPIDPLYRFDRVAAMMRDIQLHTARCSQENTIFDLLFLSSFWSLRDYMTFMRHRALLLIENIDDVMRVYGYV